MPRDGERRWIWMALGAVGTLALVVLLVLPRMNTGPLPEPPSQPLPEEASTAPPVAAAPSPDSEIRKQAESVMREFLRTRARLELAAANIWGEPEWGEAAEQALAGDRSFGLRYYPEAKDAYAGALETLTAIEQSRDARLAAALQAGWQALDDNDVQGATVHFELARTIAPDDEAAARGLARAAVRDAVLRNLRLAEQAEAEGNLQAARTAYADAAHLDPEYSAAVGGLERVSQQITDNAYRQAMSSALVAVQERRWQVADRALAEAAQLKPADPAWKDLQARLVKGRQQSRLDSLRRKAQRQAAGERWQEAIALYRQALKLEPDALFARNGLRHARERARLHEQLDHYLDQPERLYSDQPLANARKLLESAGVAPENEPVLRDKVKRLQGLVASARTPVPVILRSDGLTEVVIYHVGNRGRFLEQQLELRPGDYTAVGSRAGYRDVRKVFRVRPGIAPVTVVIQCEERI